MCQIHDPRDYHETDMLYTLFFISQGPHMGPYSPAFTGMPLYTKPPVYQKWTSGFRYISMPDIIRGLRHSHQRYDMKNQKPFNVFIFIKYQCNKIISSFDLEKLKPVGKNCTHCVWPAEGNSYYS